MEPASSSSLSLPGSSTGSFHSTIYQYVSYLPNLMLSMMGSVRSKIYNSLILQMTTNWYQAVLSRIDEGSTVLDIGVGTAGALIRCQHILKQRNIRVVGIDYDRDYVMMAQRCIAQEQLQDSIRVVHMDVYKLEEEMKDLDISGFQAAYFSGSFSLLPDMCQALRVVSKVLDGEQQRIYITQTYQRKSPPFLGYIKPWLRYITSIDFGQLIYEAEAKKLFQNTIPKECGLKLVKHQIIPGSIDTPMQAAYLTILEASGSKLVQG